MLVAKWAASKETQMEICQVVQRVTCSVEKKADLTAAMSVEWKVSTEVASKDKWTDIEVVVEMAAPKGFSSAE